MNPGKLNKRVKLYDGISLLSIVWANKIIRTKRRDDEQNEETYEFLIRKRKDLKPYMSLLCNDEWFVILTIDEFDVGYLKLKCEKSKIHSFYDTCAVSRSQETETSYGETIIQQAPVYTDISCELIKIQNARANETEQHNEISQYYIFYTENKHTFKVGDAVEINHKGDIYKGLIEESFKFHTHQEVTFKLEGEA
jgi:Phage head-tail joining protein